MVSISIILTSGFLLYGAIQTAVVYIASRRMLRPQRDSLVDAECPKVAVMLPLRGTDPFLQDCIHGLLEQDYPNMQLRIIVDNLVDPAWPVANEIVSQHPNSDRAVVEVLRDRLDTCGLRNSSLLQFESSLDDTFKAITVVDADVIAHPTWLRELMTPLASEETPVAAGNRWYIPQDASWGSLVRYIWNVGAVTQMVVNNYAWGGSISVRRDAITQKEIDEGWKRSIVSLDTCIHREMRIRGQKSEFVPSVLMTNREACDLPGFYPWLRRQMLFSKFYHPKWKEVFGHGLLSSFLILFMAVAAIYAFAIGEFTAGTIFGGSILGYLALMLVAVAMMERSVRKIVARRGETIAWLSPWRLLKLVIAMPLTQIVYTAAIIGATTMRVVTWRGITYHFDGPYDVKVSGYEPYTDGSTAMGNNPVASI